MQEHLAPGVPKKTRSGHSPLTKSKGRETSGGETRTLGRRWTDVSKTVCKVLTILAVLAKQNVGHRSVGTCRWTVKVSWIIVLGQSRGILLASGQSLLLEGVVQFPSGDALSTGSFARVNRLTGQKNFIRKYTLRSKWT